MNFFTSALEKHTYAVRVIMHLHHSDMTSYDFVERILAAVNKASFPKGKISILLHHNVN